LRGPALWQVPVITRPSRWKGRWGDGHMQSPFSGVAFRGTPPSSDPDGQVTLIAKRPHTPLRAASSRLAGCANRLIATCATSSWYRPYPETLHLRQALARSAPNPGDPLRPGMRLRAAAVAQLAGFALRWPAHHP
jgi:hypothetical protein